MIMYKILYVHMSQCVTVHEDEALLEEVMTEQVLRVVKALVCIRVVKAYMISHLTILIMLCRNCTL